MKTRRARAAALFCLALSLPLCLVAPPAAAQEEAEVEAAAEVEVVDAFAYDPEVRAKRTSGTEQEIALAHAEAAREAAREKGEYKTIQLDGMVAVLVSDLEALVGPGMRNCSALRLTFDGEPFTEAVPFRCTANLVIYNLALIDRAEEDAWQNLVKKRRGTIAYTHISLLAPDAEESLPTRATDRKILLYNRLYARFAGVGVALVILGFVPLAKRSNMLRDGGKKKSDDEPRRPYSLARVQTAWWFFLVLFAFIFITLLDGSLTDIPNSVLGLMGIAGSTFLGSELVDSSRRDDPKYEGKQAVASTHPAGFFLDIFSDAGGVAFHRFQMFVWTLLLGVVFVIRVLQNLHMPEFDASILGLMGISSGTYLGMKIPEPRKVEGAEHAPRPESAEAPRPADPGT